MEGCVGCERCVLSGRSGGESTAHDGRRMRMGRGGDGFDQSAHDPFARLSATRNPALLFAHGTVGAGQPADTVPRTLDRARTVRRRAADDQERRTLAIAVSTVTSHARIPSSKNNGCSAQHVRERNKLFTNLIQIFLLSIFCCGHKKSSPAQGPDELLRRSTAS